MYSIPRREDGKSEPVTTLYAVPVDSIRTVEGRKVSAGKTAGLALLAALMVAGAVAASSIPSSF